MLCSVSSYFNISLKRKVMFIVFFLCVLGRDRYGIICHHMRFFSQLKSSCCARTDVVVSFSFDCIERFLLNFARFLRRDPLWSNDLVIASLSLRVNLARDSHDLILLTLDGLRGLSKHPHWGRGGLRFGQASHATLGMAGVKHQQSEVIVGGRRGQNLNAYDGPAVSLVL